MKRASFLALFLLFALTLTSCAGTGSIQTGVWSEDGTTFTNEWANLTFTLPAGWRALSADEMKETFSAGEEVLVNGGTQNAALQMAKLRTAYDFLVKNESTQSNVIVSYENLAMVAGGSSLSASGYYDILKPQLTAVPDMGFVELGTSTARVGGADYFVGSYSLLGGAMLQDYYLRKVGKVMMCVIVSYTEDNRAEAEDFLSAMQPVK